MHEARHRHAGRGRSPLFAWSPAHAAGVVAVSPQGEVAQVRQVTVKFSDAVVAFGDLRLPDPFASPATARRRAGSGRWAERPGLALRLPRGAAARHDAARAKLRAEWKPAPRRAARLRRARRSTGTDRVHASPPAARRWSRCSPATAARSRKTSTSCCASTARRSRRRVLANALVRGRRHRRAAAGAHRRRRRCATQVLKARRSPKPTAAACCCCACQRPLPNDAAVRLVWGKGIAAPANPQVVTTIEQRFHYRVRARLHRRVQLRARDAPTRRACRSGR